MAFALLQDPSRDDAVEMPDLIRGYNDACGTANTDTSGYHETITLASLRAARHWLNEHPDSPCHVALKQLLASPLGQPDWLLRHWSRERLFSIDARRHWLEPDLQTLPF